MPFGIIFDHLRSHFWPKKCDLGQKRPFLIVENGDFGNLVDFDNFDLGLGSADFGPKKCDLGPKNDPKISKNDPFLKYFRKKMWSDPQKMIPKCKKWSQKSRFWLFSIRWGQKNCHRRGGDFGDFTSDRKKYKLYYNYGIRTLDERLFKMRNSYF